MTSHSIDTVELNSICSVAHYKNFNSSYYREAMTLLPLITHNWLQLAEEKRVQTSFFIIEISEI